MSKDVFPTRCMTFLMAWAVYWRQTTIGAIRQFVVG
jgi:hypothetical protein